MQRNEENEEVKYYEQAKNRAQEIKRKIVKEANIYDRDKISERLHRMILYSIGRHDWYEDRLHRLLNIGVAFIGAFVALATFMSAVDSDITLLSRIFGWLATASVLFTGIGMIYYFNSRIARDHPYRKIVDTRSWYFIYNFPSGLRDSQQEIPREEAGN